MVWEKEQFVMVYLHFFNDGRAAGFQHQMKKVTDYLSAV